jgi:hypothetical protein
MKKLLAAAALLAASATANAAVYQLEITEHLLGRANNPASVLQINPGPSFVGDTGDIPLPTFYYDSDTGILSSSGVLHLRSVTSEGTPFGRVFDRYITDLTIDLNTGDPSGTTAYLCENAPGTSQAGGFGQIVGANICGNYVLGAGGDQSTMTYGPGIAFSRVLGGDDTSAGDPQSINDYTLFLASFDGSTLVIQSADWLNTPTNSAGTQLTFSVVPVPAAVWLFGSALGLMGLARRRLAA